MADRELPEDQVYKVGDGALRLPPDSFPPLDLLLPPLELKFEHVNYFVKDILRSKWLKLSPEEWVRQHVLYWLITQTKFPSPLISIERKVSLGSFNRADVLGYSTAGQALLLVECKAAYETISKQTVMQAMKYNQHLNAPFLWLTNGNAHIVFRVESQENNLVQLKQLPSFEEMNAWV